jgi:hypothetical protein
MKLQVVRDRDGNVVCAVQSVVNGGGDEVIIEPVLEDGERLEETEIAASELLDINSLFERRSS